MKGRPKFKDILAVSFLDSRSMTSWNPNTRTSGVSTDLRQESRKLTFSGVPESDSGLAESMFQVHKRTLMFREVLKLASLLSNSSSKYTKKKQAHI